MTVIRDLVGYGRTPPDPKWPGDARIAVQIVLNYEEGSEYSIGDGDGFSEAELAESPGAVPHGMRDLATESVYEFGSRVGFWRLMRLFAERDIPITVFGCALALERNPEAAAAIVEAGYDICSHGWRWAKHWLLSEEEEREHIRLAVESLTKLTGSRPLGWYCRTGPSANTRRLVVEEGGFLYDSDAYNDELPYWVTMEGKPHLVIPYAGDLNDGKFVRPGGFATGEDFVTYAKHTFDMLYEEGVIQPKMMSIGLHNRLIGRAGRAGALARVLDYIQGHDKVWICRREDIARHWIEHHPYPALDRASPLQRQWRGSIMTSADVDPVTIEIIQNALNSFIGEMRVTIIRTAFGPNIWETHDFSCGLLAPGGDLVALSEDNPVHIVPTMYCVPAVQERFGDDIAPGDIFLLNDPYKLGTHVNDVAHIAPFFIEDRLVFWVVVRVHYPDVGGMAAGSITPDAREVYQEGLRIPAVKVYDRGEPNESFIDLLFANVRVPEERRGDFAAVMGALRTADVRLREILVNFGLENVERAHEVASERAESRMQEAIRELPEGDYSYELNLDSNGVEPGWIPLRVTITIDHGADTPMTVDFSESAPAVPGPMNGAPATAACAAVTAIKAFLDPHSQINGGTFRPIEIVTKPGTIFEAPHPSAMCGSLDLGYRVIALVMGALGAIRPESAVGDHVSPSHQYMPVWDPIRERQYVFYDVPIGGTGAVSDHDGGDAIAGFERGDFPRVSSAEVWEHQVPFMAEEIALRPDSGGAGEFRGGLAMRRSWRVLTDSGSVSDLSEPGLVSNYGVSGGYGGVPSTCRIERGGKSLWPGDEAGTGKATRYPIREGDIVRFDKWGGGGYGDALARDPGRVLEDIQEGYVTADSAEALYGVVISDGVVDEGATADKRQALRDARVILGIAARDSDLSGNGERLWEITQEVATALKVTDGQVLECLSPGRPPLRGRARISRDARPGQIAAGPMARKVLGVKGDDTVWLRHVPAFHDADA